jgi:hypothetical protein
MTRVSALLLFATLVVPSGTFAQDGTSESPFVFALPEPVLQTGSDEHGLIWAQVGLPLDACADHFVALYRSETPLAPGWSISGFGTSPGGGDRWWAFGVLVPPNELFELRLSEVAGGCRIEFDPNPWLIQTDPYRWSWSPLVLLNGTTLDLEPLTQAP